MFRFPDNLSDRVVKLKDIQIGERCLLMFDYKPGNDPLKVNKSQFVTRSPLIGGKDGQLNMLTTFRGKGVSFSATTVAIREKELQEVSGPNFCVRGGMVKARP